MSRPRFGKLLIGLFFLIPAMIYLLGWWRNPAERYALVIGCGFTLTAIAWIYRSLPADKPVPEKPE